MASCRNGLRVNTWRVAVAHAWPDAIDRRELRGEDAGSPIRSAVTLQAMPTVVEGVKDVPAEVAVELGQAEVLDLERGEFSAVLH